MNANQDSVTLDKYIENLLMSSAELSLTDIMLCYYKKPCRCMFPGISCGRTATDMHVQRGSVIITEKEVILFIDPTDKCLIGPVIGEKLDIDFEEPTTMYQHGTTIIRKGISKRQVTFYLNDGLIKDGTIDKQIIWNRWHSKDLMGRTFKCFEHYQVSGSRTALGLTRF